MTTLARGGHFFPLDRPRELSEAIINFAGRKCRLDLAPCGTDGLLPSDKGNHRHQITGPHSVFTPLMQDATGAK